MSEAKMVDQLAQAERASVWARLLRDQFNVKYKPSAAAAQVLKEVAAALLQAGEGLQAGRVTPAGIIQFANAVMAEGVALERAAGVPLNLGPSVAK
jgi:hypothetical protein